MTTNVQTFEKCINCDNDTFDDNITRLRLCPKCGRCEGCQILDRYYPISYSHAPTCQCLDFPFKIEKK